MKVTEIYQKIIQHGTKVDPRGKKGVEEDLKKVKKEYDKLSPPKKKSFDKEKLTNPFNDTRILHIASKKDIQKIIVGIDIDGSELLLVDRLNQKGAGIDLIIGHHPLGKSIPIFTGVMYLQADIQSKFGVPINIAESLIEERAKEVERKVMAGNFERTVDFARHLNISLMCAHTPADNCVTNYLQKLFDRKKPRYIGDIVETLEEIPEYRYAILNNSPPKILVGNEGRRAGKIFVDMTGGTTGNKKAIQNLATAGVGTMVCMHIPEEHLKEAEKEKINIVIAGHIASDNMGMNILLDNVLPKDKIKVLQFSGFKRVKRQG